MLIQLCSDRGENQGHSYSVLSTSIFRARVRSHPSTDLDSDETVLGRRTVWKTGVWWSRQSF